MITCRICCAKTFEENWIFAKMYLNAIERNGRRSGEEKV